MLQANRPFTKHFACDLKVGLQIRVSMSKDFLFHRGPLFGFSTKDHRDGGSDSIGGEILLKKANFVEPVILLIKLNSKKISAFVTPYSINIANNG